MAYLAIIGSHKVNGVAELHSDLLKSTLFKDFVMRTILGCDSSMIETRDRISRSLGNRFSTDCKKNRFTSRSAGEMVCPADAEPASAALANYLRGESVLLAIFSTDCKKNRFTS
jgi:hypothetical protein